MEPDFDFAIVGAGVAGWSLAWRLTEGPLRARRLVVIDGARDDEKLQTLAFWSARPTFLEALVRHRWKALRVGGRGQPLALEQYCYQALFFADLQAEARRRVLAVDGNEVVGGRLEAMSQDESSACLSVGGRELTARWVFDSRFAPRSHAVDLTRHHRLEQHFRGWVVRATRDAFDASVPTFMDFRAGTPAGTGFFYVLPFSARDALVEVVTLSPVAAESLRDTYLSEHWGLGPRELEVVNHEAGVSLLADGPFRWREGPCVRRIGLAAGMLKPSTGYALTRILEDVEALVGTLQAHGHPWGHRRRSAFFSFLDGVLLELWAHRPDRVPGVLVALLEKNPVDRVLRFLDERASVVEVLKVGWSLPVITLAGAALRWLARRWLP